MQKFIVHKTNLLDENGVKKRHGEVVELGQALARRYGKLGFLRPFFDEETPEEEDDGDTVAETETKFARTRRVSAESHGPAISGGSSTKSI